MPFDRVLMRLAASACALAWAAGAFAEDYPAKSIRIVVPFTAGGAVDGTARLLAVKMQQAMGVPVIVDNRPGAGGNIGVEFVARAAPDGATILLNTNGQSISPAIYKHLAWSPRDFIPVTQVFATTVVIATSAKQPMKTLQDLIALAKAKPGALTYGSTGVGNALHLTMELLKLRAGVDLAMASYRGDAQVIAALLGQEVQVAPIPMSTAKSQVESGALRALATTSAERAQGLPNTPTVAEQGLPGFQAGGYQGLFAPAGTPRPIVERIWREAKAALASPEIKQAADGFGVEAVGSSPDDFAAFYAKDVEAFKAIVRDARIPMQE